MSLPSRVLVVALLVTGFCGCATHDRLAYEHDYWRGRNLKKADDLPKTDAEIQAKLDAAAANPGSVGVPAVPGNTGLPQEAPFGAPAGAAPATPSPATPPSTNPFDPPPGAGL